MFLCMVNFRFFRVVSFVRMVFLFLVSNLIQCWSQYKRRINFKNWCFDFHFTSSHLDGSFVVFFSIDFGGLFHSWKRILQSIDILNGVSDERRCQLIERLKIVLWKMRIGEKENRSRYEDLSKSVLYTLHRFKRIFQFHKIINNLQPNCTAVSQLHPLNLIDAGGNIYNPWFLFM